MSRAAALAEARVLKGFLEAQGVRVSIELVEGTRKSSGWLATPGQFRVEMSHHIVSRRSQGLTPFLHLVKVGRPDVKGPLCNLYGGFDEIARIITMGVANHSGLGGPMTVDGVTIAQNMAAYFAFGHEFEGGMVLADFTTSYRRFMAATNAGVLDYLRHRNGRTTDEGHCEHSTWAPGRKSDRLLYTRAEGIAEIRAVRAGGPLTAYPAEHVREVQELLSALGYDPGPVDGDLGPRTREAVEAFQRATGLVEDGDPGPITIAALRAAVADQEDDMPRFIKPDGSNSVYITDGLTKRYIPNPTALSHEQKVWGTRDIFTVPKAVIDAIPDAIKQGPGMDAEAIAAAVRDALSDLPGGVNPDDVAGRVVEALVARISS